MGFFSKKTSAPDTIHEIVDAKIHTMQHDLEEIAKNGHVQIETTRKESPLSKEKSINPEQKLATDSPFFQSTPSALDGASSKKADSEISLPKETHDSLKKNDDTIKNSSQAQVSESPIVQAVIPPISPIPPIPPQPSSETPPQDTLRQELPPLIPKKDPEEKVQSEKELKQLEQKSGSIRTGTWPVENVKKKTFDAKPLSPKKISPQKMSARKATFEKKPLLENIVLKEQWGWKSYFILIIIVIAIGGGAFFFWKTRFQEVSLPEISNPALPDIESNPKAEELRYESKSEENLPFSTTRANVFLIDVETESISTLREKLMKNAEDIKNAGIESPVRFSVVDKTNTPIAFFMFASIFNLGLSADLLNSLGNDFFLWIFFDEGFPRLVLSINIKNVDDTNTHIAISEKTFPVSLKNIFLVETPLKKRDSEFGDGLYRDVAIRYLNFQSEEPLSIDYSTVRDILIIGTSKNSTRAVIDIVLDEESEKKE